MFRLRVEGSASSGSKWPAAGPLEELEADKNDRRAGWVAYCADARRDERYQLSPCLRSAMSESSTHADGINAVVRMRLGGSAPGSARVVCSWTN